jgi:hypothetical protein
VGDSVPGRFLRMSNRLDGGHDRKVFLFAIGNGNNGNEREPEQDPSRSSNQSSFVIPCKRLGEKKIKNTFFCREKTDSLKSYDNKHHFLFTFFLYPLLKKKKKK